MNLYSFIYFLSFACSSGYLLGLVFRFLIDHYSPKGSSTDTSHIWVYADSGRKYSDATVRAVYERKHGSGSWNSKIESEKRLIWSIGLTLSAVGPLSAKWRATPFPISFFDLELILVFLGCVLSLAFYLFSSKYDWDLLSSAVFDLRKYKPESYVGLFFWLLLPVYLGIPAGLIMLYCLIPAIRLPVFEEVIPIMLLFFLTGIALLVYRMLRPRKPKLTEEYEKALADEKARKELITHFARLLMNSDSLEKRKQSARALSLLTGKGFGDDLERWEKWYKNQ
jgi:hypothetical protein